MEQQKKWNKIEKYLQIKNKNYLKHCKKKKIVQNKANVTLSQLKSNNCFKKRFNVIIMQCLLWTFFSVTRVAIVYYSYFHSSASHLHVPCGNFGSLIALLSQLELCLPNSSPFIIWEFLKSVWPCMGTADDRNVFSETANAFFPFSNEWM